MPQLVYHPHKYIELGKTVKGKHWIYLVINIVFFVFLGFTYFRVFNVKYGFTLPSITIGLPLLVGMFFLAFDTVYMVRRKDIGRGQRGYVVGFVAVMLCITLLPHMGSFMLSHLAKIPQTYSQTEESLVLAQVLKEYSRFHSNVTDYTVIYPEFTDSYRNLTEVQLKDKKDLVVQNMVKTNNRKEYPQVYDDSKISSVVDRFISLNLTTTTMAMKSAPEDNYYIDYDYIARFPGGWDYEHKLVNMFKITIEKTSVKVSRPYWDKDTGLVLVDFSDTVYVFSYHDGRAEMVDMIPRFGYW
jgi:hypothetical protein